MAVVAIDDSVEGQNALAAAKELARRGSLRLVLVHGFPPRREVRTEWGTSLGSSLARIDQAYEEKLARIAERMRRKGFNVKTVVRQGWPPRVVLEEAESTRAGLIVVGTAGRRGLARLAVGSNAEAILRASTVPVLVTPTRSKPERLRHGPVLAAIDFAPTGKDIVAAAAALARDLHADLQLLHSVVVPAYTGDFTGAAVPMAQLLGPDTAAAEAQITALASEVRGVDASSSVATGDPARTVLAQAKAAGAQAIVVGRHGARLGSVSSAIVRMADRPVIVVPDRERSAGPLRGRALRRMA